ncbi:MAG: hypothetical protein ACLSWR_04365 [Ruthenibacterium sp.]
MHRTKTPGNPDGLPGVLMHLKAKLCAEDNAFLQERSFLYVFLALLFCVLPGRFA